MKLFRSDFRVVADYFVNAYNNPGYEPDPAVITHVDEFLGRAIIWKRCLQ